jgi:hypothetical protein
MDFHGKRVLCFKLQHLSMINSRYEAVRGLDALAAFLSRTGVREQLK